MTSILVTLLRWHRRHATGIVVPPDESGFGSMNQRLKLAQARFAFRSIPPLPDGTLDTPGDRMQLARRGYGRDD